MVCTYTDRREREREEVIARARTAAYNERATKREREKVMHEKDGAIEESCLE